MAERAARRAACRARWDDAKSLECQEEQDDRGGAQDQQRCVREAIGAHGRVMTGQARRVAFAEMRQSVELRRRLCGAQHDQRDQDNEVSPASDQGPYSLPRGAW